MSPPTNVNTKANPELLQRKQLHVLIGLFKNILREKQQASNYSGLLSLAQQVLENRI